MLSTILSLFAQGSTESAGADAGRAIARRRLSSASAMRGYASRRRISSVIPNAISVQTITPAPGWTRKFPPPAAVTSPAM